eukprot:TRINITY_DN9683_c0_g1_i1.p1 TRINITY_DN9683_c0_g1~~TRINITY_DN9683_c0_g1_i1.p1  ORF type:complete len:199 (-),score=20.82 TRINITY_DN9683_c0_g1_i1:84-680(-)
MASSLQRSDLDVLSAASKSDKDALHEVVGHEKTDKTCATQAGYAHICSDDPGGLVNSQRSEAHTKCPSRGLVESDAQPSSSTLPLTIALKQYGMPSSSLQSLSPELMPPSSLPAPPQEGTWVLHETLWGKPYQYGSQHSHAPPASSSRSKQPKKEAASEIKQLRFRRLAQKRQGGTLCFSSPEHGYDVICNPHGFRFQ